MEDMEESHVENKHKNLAELSIRSHRAADPPICSECKELDLSFFDPTCLGCRDLLKNPHTTVAEIFAIIRQWVPQTQQNIDILVEEILNRGININDRDGLTDMNLLHYVAKSGAIGMGDIKVSSKVARMLIDKRIDVNAKCRWTDMTPLHLAVYFDIEEVVKILLEASSSYDIDCRCKEFDNGTALHIGCMNLSAKSVKILLEYGSSPYAQNSLGKLPIQCIPNVELSENNSEAEHLALALKNELTTAMKDTDPNIEKQKLNLATLHALGLEMHEKVTVAGKVGILRYCGSTNFASGQWAGIELDKPLGKNDGSINGFRYFSCPPDHGIFAPLTRVNKYNKNCVARFSLPDSSSSVSTDIQLGDRVIVAGKNIGHARYIGPTEFASGSWIGVELIDPVGKNNGTVAGTQYFQCEPKHGVFAPRSKVQLANFNISEDLDLNEDSLTESPRTTIKKSSPKLNSMLPKPKVANLDRTLGVQLNFTLTVGMSVFVNNEMGVVRFIGRVDFADDIWLGVELRKPNGKNDGTVEGKKYFSCKPLHGLMVRPSKATCRGINCAQLIDLKFR
ncbi:CAP-Gly domain-containing linker protein 4 isoform X1 [Hydra vulgaris]|uniref:CAP-Gly domain-containing linker protein 4 isoform X1 n=2 Tax=Hydra vulgaris TaxID=6087 RepID=UPI00064104E2|nr:CAP-Gly domain-containing linker protein 4 isoform X1 [Hydra vulgaris]